MPSAIMQDRLSILALCVLVQLPGLLHWIDTDPLLLLSPLGEGGRPGLLPGNPGWIDPNFGTTLQALGRLAATQWLSGKVPWWNPYSGIGAPLAAEMQPAALFLPFIMLLRLHDGLVWLRAAMCAVAGLGGYELARAMGLRRGACCAAGLLFAFNGTIAWLPHGPDRASAFLPWLLLGIERARHHAIAARPGGWCAVAVGLAWSIYAGFPETAYLDGLFAAVWSLWRLLVLRGGPPSTRSAWTLRRRLFGKLLSGVTAGLLLAAPAIWPFIQYLAISDIGSHARGFADTALPSVAFPMFLVPYLYGPIDALGTYPTGPLWTSWGNIGGYVGAAAAVLGLLGLTGLRSREAGLRLVLAGWILLCLAKTAALPGVTGAVNLLPLMTGTAFFRYAEPSWSLAAVMLAALAIDDWQRGTLRRLRCVVSGLAALTLLAACLRLALPTMRGFVPHPGYRAFAFCALAWCGCLALALPTVLAGRPDRRRVATMLFLVGLDAVTMFALPLACATRGVRRDDAPIAFLRAHLGLQRFYSTGAILPNYGALFGLASINADMLPVPRNWAQHVNTALDPLAEPAGFTGRSDGPGQDPRAALLARLDAYRDLGVAYVVTLRGSGSLLPHFDADPPGASPLPWVMAPGSGVNGDLPPGFAHGRRVESLIVKVGTYGGLADGDLDAAVCTPAACSVGTVALHGAPDNVGVTIALSPVLVTSAGDRLSFRLSRRGGGGPLALWLFAGSAARDVPKLRTGYGPGLALGYEDSQSDFKRVFAGERIEIFALSHPAAYFTASPPCLLDTLGRQAVIATCPTPASLVRRELSFPGWRARVDGQPTTVGTAGIFQTVAIPAGRSEVHFDYAPPFVRLAWIAFWLSGIWMVLASARRVIARLARYRAGRLV